MSVAGGPSLAHSARAAESTPRNQALQALETPRVCSQGVGAVPLRPAPAGATDERRFKGELMCAELARDAEHG